MILRVYTFGVLFGPSRCLVLIRVIGPSLSPDSMVDEESAFATSSPLTSRRSATTVVYYGKQKTINRV